MIHSQVNHVTDVFNSPMDRWINESKMISRIVVNSVQNRVTVSIRTKMPELLYISSSQSIDHSYVLRNFVHFLFLITNQMSDVQNTNVSVYTNYNKVCGGTMISRLARDIRLNYTCDDADDASLALLLVPRAIVALLPVGYTSSFLRKKRRSTGICNCTSCC